MTKLVTIGIPVYKRLHYLPQALQSVAAQDYPDIELIVSDNGMNGKKVKEIVDQWYSRPYRFRQNPTTVRVALHYNQLIDEATGEYFVSLDDDDAISPNFVSNLVTILERDPRVAMAMGRQEIIDASGRLLRASSEQIPDLLTGEDFVRGWTQYGFANYTTFLARTRELQQTRGFPDIGCGFHIEDALVLKLCLGRLVAVSQRCAFRFRRDDSSMTRSLSWEQLAEATRGFVKFLDTDSNILAYARTQPVLWAELKECLVTMTWRTYLEKWGTIYRQRLSLVRWLRAGVALPYIPNYYLEVQSYLMSALKEMMILQAKRLIPWAFKLYRILKHPTK